MNYKNLPLIVQDKLYSMSNSEQSSFKQEYERRSKSSVTAYVFWLFLGWHYAYLRKWGLQVLFLLSLGGFLIWWIIDLFRVASIVRNYNKDLAIEIMKDITLIYGSKNIGQPNIIKENNPFEEWKKLNPAGTINDFYKNR